MKKEIIGHIRNREILNKVLQSTIAHHSFLFSGPAHIGKYSIAHSFAHDLTKGSTTCTWEIYDGVDTDIFCIRPQYEEKKERIVIHDISVEAMTEATRFMALSPDKKARILIIDDAHRMTLAAQNALLKTLEEPKKNRFIILVTHNADALLQTIHSRCFHMHFTVVESDVLEEVYGDSEYIHDLSGRPGFLARVQTDEKFRETVEYARMQLQQIAQKKLYERILLADELAKKDDEYINTFFHIWIYRIWFAAHKTEKFYLIKVADKIEQMLQLMQSTNVNKRLVLEDFLIHIV